MRRISVILLLLASAALLRAQNFDLSWYTIDGGGGTSSSGVYTVTGTIGQPDAGHMSGGTYTIDGGFWGLIAAIQTPGAPFLTITHAGSNVIISWPAPSSGFNLQQNANLSGTNWSGVVQSIVTNNGMNTVTISATNNLFFRLKSP